MVDLAKDISIAAGFASIAGSNAYDYSYQVSPIILVGGIAANAVGGVLPIIALLGQSPLIQGVANTILGQDDYFARFIPIPGSMLINNQVGTYPFANQQTAANALIQQPLTISLEMIAPCKNPGDYASKLSVWTALQQSLLSHNNAGGTYNVATPAYIYTNCLLTSMQNIPSGDSKQVQIKYQLDFVQPLLTRQQATSAYNSLMGKVAAGQQVTTPQWSGGNSTVGTPAQNASSGLSGQVGSVNVYPTGPGQ
jgi:hypothetical protein